MASPFILQLGYQVVCWLFWIVMRWLSSLSLDLVILIHGRFVKSNDECFQADVYVPCEGAAKRLLWDRLTVQFGNYVGKNMCLWYFHCCSWVG